MIYWCVLSHLTFRKFLRCPGVAIGTPLSSKKTPWFASSAGMRTQIYNCRNIATIETWHSLIRAFIEPSYSLIQPAAPRSSAGMRTQVSVWFHADTYMVVWLHCMAPAASLCGHRCSTKRTYKRTHIYLHDDTYIVVWHWLHGLQHLCNGSRCGCGSYHPRCLRY